MVHDCLSGFIYITSISWIATQVRSDTVVLTRQSNDCMYGSDIIRMTHQVNNLTWDENFRTDGEDWAIRMALKGVMEHSPKQRAEVLYMSYGMSSECANGLYTWYKTISNFNYSDPKWTMDNGCFIQEVYSKVKSAGFGTATYKKKVFMVGIYDYEMMTTDPLDLKHVTKPIRNLTKEDLIPADGSHASFLEIPMPPESQVWTNWVKTSTCKGICGESTQTEERWCVHGDYIKDCVGERKREVVCLDNCTESREPNKFKRVPSSRKQRRSKFMIL